MVKLRQQTAKKGSRVIFSNISMIDEINKKKNKSAKKKCKIVVEKSKKEIKDEILPIVKKASNEKEEV